MPDQPALAQRVSSSFAQLLNVASDLNVVSDDLGKSVTDIDTALKKLNLGLSVWVKVCGWEANGYRGSLAYWTEDIGFSKVKGKWGVSLRRVEGDYNYPDDDDVDEWLFGDAPRALRLQAIDKLPDLIEKLNDEARRITAEIQRKLPDVRAVAAALNPGISKATGGSGTGSVKLNQVGRLSSQGASGWELAALEAGGEAAAEPKKISAKDIFGSSSKGAK